MMPEADADGVRLAAISDAAAAASLKQALTPFVASRRRVCVDAEDVERIGTACIQVLLAADQALVRLGAGLAVRGATEAMRSAFADLGLGAELEQWIDANG